MDGELRAIEGPESDAAEKAWLMTTASKIIRNFYRDSVSLMQLSSRLARLAGVNQASAIMASDANLALLREAKLLSGAIDAGPNDLIITVEGQSDAAIADAAPDLGDSAITETAGLGGFAMAAAPAIVNFVGGTPEDAIANTARMAYITLGRNSGLTLPAMGFAGAPSGIDARRVVDTGVCPIINTGVAHKEAGVGQIGAGVTHAPLDCFANAVAALAADLPADRGG